MADISNTVVIMTSNIGSQRILETDIKIFETEEGRQALEDVLKENLSDRFRPEFLDRLDDIIVFKPLTKQDLLAIIDIQLRRLKQLLADREIEVHLSDARSAALAGDLSNLRVPQRGRAERHRNAFRYPAGTGVPC